MTLSPDLDHALTRVFRRRVLATLHGVLQDLKGLCLEAEDSALRLLSSSEEPDHHRALVEGVENLRDLRRAVQSHARHGVSRSVNLPFFER